MTLSAALPRGRRAIRRGWLLARREFRHGRLDLHDLPTGTRRLARVALGLIAVSAVIVAARALELTLPGPVVALGNPSAGAGTPATVPMLPILVADAGLCVAAAALAVANHRSGRRLSRIALVGIGVLGLAVSSLSVAAGRDLARLEAVLGSGFTIPSPPASSVIGIAGWVGIGCALLAIGLALAPARRVNPWVLAFLATVPFALPAVLVVGVGYESFDLGASAAGLGLPQVLTASSYVAPALLVLATVVPSWLVPLGLWQVVTWARASRREIGRPIAAGDAHWPWLLAALLTLKLGWLALGFAGRLPVVLGGGSAIWGRSTGDGLPAWVIAIAFAALAGWWLASPRRFAISELGFTPAAILVVIGFSAVTVVMSLVLAALPVVALLPATPRTQEIAAACGTTWPTEAVGNAITCAIDGLIGSAAVLTELVQLGTLVACIAVAAWLWRRPGHRAPVIFLVAVVAWVAPRVPDVVRDLLGLAVAPSIAPELATFDAVLTIVLAVLALAWYAGRQRGADPPALLLVLVVSTLLVHAGTVVPAGSVTVLFFLALLFPIGYELLFDSEPLNHRSPGRPARVLEALGVRTGVLSLAALGVAFGSIVPGELGWDQVGRLLFAVPFSALLVAATISRGNETVEVVPDVPAGSVAASADRVAIRAPEAPAPDVPPPVPAPLLAPRPRAQPRVLALGVVGAALVLTGVVALGSAADTAIAAFATAPVATSNSAATPSPAPTPDMPSRLKEFAAHIAVAHQAVADRLASLQEQLTAGTLQPGVIGLAIEGQAADEWVWLQMHPPADCYATVAGDWQAAMDQFAALGRALATLSEVNDAAAQAAFGEASSAFIAADGTFIESMSMVGPRCGVGPSPSP